MMEILQASLFLIDRRGAGNAPTRWHHSPRSDQAEHPGAGTTVGECLNNIHEPNRHTHTDVHTDVHRHTHTQMYIQTHRRIYIHTQTYTDTHTDIHRHTHTCTLIQTHTHTHTFTHNPNELCFAMIAYPIVPTCVI